MASPYKYSGPAMAAGAIGTAISDMFTGLLEGEANKQKIAEQAERMSQLKWQAQKEQTFLPFEARKMSLDIEKGEQGITKGALDIAGSREELEQRPTQRAREAKQFEWAGNKEGREAGRYGWESEEQERAKEAYTQQQEGLKNLPKYLELGDKGIAAWLARYGHVIKNPMMQEFAKQWTKQHFPDPLLEQKKRKLEAETGWLNRRTSVGGGKLSAEDKEALRQDQATLRMEMGNLKQIESALGRGDKPEQEPGKPWTKSSVASAKSQVMREMQKISARLKGQEEVEAATAQELWDKTFGKDESADEGDEEN